MWTGSIWRRSCPSWADGGAGIATSPMTLCLAPSVIGPGGETLGGGNVLGPGDGTLGCGDIVGAVVGRYVDSIFRRVLVACICSSPTANMDDDAGLLRASAKYSTACRSALVEDIFETWKLCVKSYTVFIILYARVDST